MEFNWNESAFDPQRGFISTRHLFKQKSDCMLNICSPFLGSICQHSWDPFDQFMYTIVSLWQHYDLSYASLSRCLSGVCG